MFPKLDELARDPEKRFQLCWKMATIFTIIWIALSYLVVITVILTSKPDQELQEMHSCKNGQQWIRNDTVLYYPDFFDYQFQSDNFRFERIGLSFQICKTFREFSTLIINCPYIEGSNYTEHEMELAYILAEARDNAEDVLLGLPATIWFQIGNGNWSACVNLAKAVNERHPGTIKGMVITDEHLLEFALYSNILGAIMSHKSLDQWWKHREDSTFGNWEHHGLQTGLMVSSMYCFAFEKQIPKGFMKPFNNTFYLEEAPNGLVVANGIPFLTVTEKFKSCRDHLNGRFDLKLSLPLNIVPKLAVTHPYCLV